MAKFNSLLVLIHAAAVCHYWFGMYYELNHVNLIEPYKSLIEDSGAPLKGRSMFLTFLDMIVQAIFFTLCLINDVLGTNEATPKKLPTIRKLKDYVFATFAFPLAMTVGLTFWALMSIDRELVLPKAFDEFFPTWLNHVMHTNIVIFIVLEMFISVHQYPIRKSGLTGLGIFMVAYLVWIHIIKLFAGVWVYPVLDVLNNLQRLVFYLVVLGFCGGMYFIGEYVNNKVWGAELKQKSIKSKKK